MGKKYWPKQKFELERWREAGSATFLCLHSRKRKLPPSTTKSKMCSKDPWYSLESWSCPCNQAPLCRNPTLTSSMAPKTLWRPFGDQHKRCILPGSRRGVSLESVMGRGKRGFKNPMKSKQQQASLYMTEERRSPPRLCRGVLSACSSSICGHQLYISSHDLIPSPPEKCKCIGCGGEKAITLHWCNLSK